MALFGKKTTQKEDAKEENTSREEEVLEMQKPANQSAKGKKKKEEKKESRTEISKITKDIILEPWITEKSHAHMALNKYIFRVNQDFGKEDVKKAIQAMYNVSVISVNIINVPAKKRVYGRFIGKKSGYKKAVVTLKEGDKIELFKGV